jgi:hypothetical protein
MTAGGAGRAHLTWGLLAKLPGSSWGIPFIQESAPVEVFCTSLAQV